MTRRTTKPENRLWELYIDDELAGLFHTKRTAIASKVGIDYALRMKFSKSDMPSMTIKKRKGT